MTNNNSKINKFDVDKKAFIGKETLEDTDVRIIQHGFDKLAIMSKTQILITTPELRKITLIR